ncbi:MAG: methylenetetrahydrofolate reductase [Methanobacteriota archaeon]|nr:MAG: methylenetetrahydrofolate reductase [Euryarchaeota archaeon]
MAGSRPLRVGSHLEKVLAAGTFAVTAEVTPDASASPNRTRAQARALRGHVDAVNVTDSPRAMVKISSLAASAILLQEGVEPVMQMVTRDRNRIALQADILGAHALGVRNIVAMSGDDPRLGNEPDAVPVYEWTTEQFLAAAKQLRDHGKLAGGEVIDDPPNLFLGATVNPFGAPAEETVVNLRGKVDAGADFVQTQAVFDIEAFEEWMRLVRKEWLHEKTHIVAGVIPLRSAKMAKFLDDKVPGIDIPSAVFERLGAANEVKTEGLHLAVETVDRLRGVEGVRGVHIMAVEWDDAVPKIVSAAGLHPRPS